MFFLTSLEGFKVVFRTSHCPASESDYFSLYFKSFSYGFGKETLTFDIIKRIKHDIFV